MTKKGATPIAIIGASCMFPRAQSLQEYWSNITRRVDCITDVPATHWRKDDYYDADPKRPDHTYGYRGGFLDPVDFDPTEWGLTPGSIEATDTTQLFGLMVAQGALVDAGYGPGREFDRNRVNVVLGVTGTLELVIPLGARLGHPHWRRAMKAAGIPDGVAQEVVDHIGDAYVSWQEASFPGLLGNVAAGRIANRLDLGGTNCVVDAACASSFGAVHLACMELETGRTDMAVTGGVDTFNDIFMFMCFSKTPALSKTNRIRPFDTACDGTLLGEGVGMLVLKRLEDAEAAGDQIYAVIRNVGSSSDGRGKAIYAPDSKGQAKALRRAYEGAGVSVDSVELVEAHGTGTQAGDATELEGLRLVFGDGTRPRPWCALGSVKSQIGHAKAAAGVAGLIKTALALHHKVLPPTINVEQPAAILADADSPFYVNTEARPWFPSADHPRRAGVSSFGFGGSNFHLLLEEYRPEKTVQDWDGSSELVALSAATRAELTRKLGAFRQPMAWSAFRVEAARSRLAFAPGDEHRLAFVVDRDGTASHEVAASAAAGLERQATSPSWTSPDGVYFGSGRDLAGSVAVLFPGQGAQYVGMGADAACRFPLVHGVLERADGAFGVHEGSGQRLRDLIHPAPAFTEEARSAQQAALTSTDVAQPAIGAVSLGLWRLFESLGLKPAAVAGHSYGELVALAAAGRLDEATFFEVSKLRGRLMARGSGDRGSMLAVQGSLAQVEEVIALDKLDLVVANKNAPNQMVLSGATAEVKRAREAFKARKIRCTQLDVAAAFHSKLVSDAEKPFRASLDAAPFPAGSFAVYANSTGDPYPSAAPAARDMLGGQLARPVEFVRMLDHLYESGCRTFVEVGPGARLSGLVKQILGDRPHRALAVDSSNGRRRGVVDLARALAELASLGLAVDVAAWQDASGVVKAEEARRKPRMAVPICGANYRGARRERPAAAHRPLVTEDEAGRRVAEAEARATARAAAAAPPAAPAPRPASPVPQAAPVTRPSVPAPVPSSVVPAAADMSPGMLDALRVTLESLMALQRMQEQAATLHHQFLQGQQTAHRTLQGLVEQQGVLFGTATAPAVAALPVASASAPAFSPAPPPAPVLPSVPTSVAPAPTAAPAPKPVAPAPKPVTPAPRPVVPSTEASRPGARTGSGAGDSSSTQSVLLAVVAEKTGYPADMLNLDMDMEADLGIDSIKRVEIMSAMQERLPGAATVQPEQMTSLRTLKQVLAALGSVGVSATPPTPVPASPPPGARAGDSSSTHSVLLAVVADKTGYPADMLNLDMDMEADLGIDSIKRVEIMSAMQERLPNAPTVQPEQMTSLRTLRQVLDAIGSAGPVPVTATPAVMAPSAPARSAAGAGSTQSVLLAVVADKTGYPADMLNLDMDMEADLGIDSIKRVEIMSAMQERLPEAPTVQPEQMTSLRTLRQVLAAVAASSAGAVAAPANSSLPSPKPGAGAGDSSSTQSVLLEVVSDKTGYPADMLNLDMDMEADLGIDSIKRVEIMSAMQERLPEAPTVQPEQMTSLRTLRQVLDAIGSAGPVPVTATPAVMVPSAPARSAAAAGSTQSVLLAVVSEKTGYPADMLNLDMDMEADLGIDSIKRVEIMSAMQERLPDAPTVQPEQMTSLRTLRQVLESIGHAGAGAVAAPADSSSPSSKPGAKTGESTSSTTQGVLLDVVSEKTGYPADMLNLDMDMEADLGIDSIKRVEIMSAVQERLPDAPTVQPEQMTSLRTLRQVLDTLGLGGGGGAVNPRVAGGGALAPAGTQAQNLIPLRRTLVEAAPVEGEAEPFHLPTGSLVWVLRGDQALADAVAADVTRRGMAAQVLGVEGALGADVPADLAGLVIVAPSAGLNGEGLWHAGSVDFLKRSFMAAQRCAPVLLARAEAGAALFATVSRLDGAFGFLGWDPQSDPALGGLAGLTKTAGHEWPRIHVKALDVARSWTDAPAAARAVVDELLRGGVCEVGLSPGRRLTLVEHERPVPAAALGRRSSGAVIAPGDVVLVSGGARGVTAETAEALARAFRPTLVLLGRSELPAAEEPWLAGVTLDADLKRTLLAHATDRPSPKELEARFRAVVAAREVRGNLARLEAAGATVVYHALDVRRPEAVRRVVDEVRRRFGPIRGIVHGAGVLRDRRILDKTAEQLDDVLDTKIRGLRSLIEAAGDDDVRFMVFFSSSTGRYGRTGQVDYAMANEVLNKVAHQQAARRPACRVVSINWGPWDGGMVTPALKKLFASEGVGVIPLLEGGEQLVDEVATPPDPAVEVVVGGYPPEGTAATNPAVSLPGGRGRPAAAHARPALERVLDLTTHGFLADHVMNGDPVLPVALVAEFLGAAALQASPGHSFLGFDELRILKGVVLAGGAAYPIRVTATGDEVLTAELRGGASGAERLHARARVLLTRHPRRPEKVRLVRPSGSYALTVEQAYERVLFHGPAFRAISAVLACGPEGIVVRTAAAPPPAQWMSAPPRSSWLADPLALDTAFQAMILWTQATHGLLSLPTAVASYRQFADAFPADGVVVVCRAEKAGPAMARADVEFVDATGSLVARLSGYECTMAASLRGAFERRTLAAAPRR